MFSWDFIEGTVPKRGQTSRQEVCALLFSRFSHILDLILEVKRAHIIIPSIAKIRQLTVTDTGECVQRHSSN